MLSTTFGKWVEMRWIREILQPQLTCKSQCTSWTFCMSFAVLLYRIARHSYENARYFSMKTYRCVWVWCVREQRGHWEDWLDWRSTRPAGSQFGKVFTGRIYPQAHWEMELPEARAARFFHLKEKGGRGWCGGNRRGGGRHIATEMSYSVS